MAEEAPLGPVGKEYWEAKWGHVAPARVIEQNDPRYGAKSYFIRAIRKRAGDIHGLRVLELGGGGANYRLAAMTKWLGVRPTVIDYSREGLRLLENIFQANGETVEALQGDFYDFDFGGRKWDMVVHWGVIEHYDDPAPCIKLSAALLKPGGILLFTTPNMEALGAALWRRWSRANWEKHVLHAGGALETAVIQAGMDFRSIFWFGPPALQMSAWERKGLAQSAVTVAQRCANMAGRIIPLYHLGARRISNERGVLAVRPLSAEGK